ncbi:DUF1178 family protein [Sphingomonas parva]|uniref:DUF1178 family protein n=1 Tax=Sphingomonas parva TaxID=2555898 RepID=A0A4Y8ZQ76_9SPHN|nr:DUF1178 family protein [Sphingomonas parva]TFI57432.1 DUF1178 family protein [Sphingomonas parva]
MIVFDLKCAPGAHVFEAWFGSSADYDDQKARGLVSCPLCGSDDVGKAPMAPAVPAKANTRRDPAVSAPAAAPAPAEPEAIKAMLAAAAALQRQMLEKSESVGDRFVDEARAIHLGEAEARAIHGRATPADAAALVEEGIAIAPLPFPVIEPGQEN